MISGNGGKWRQKMTREMTTTPLSKFQSILSQFSDNLSAEIYTRSVFFFKFVLTHPHQATLVIYIYLISPDRHSFEGIPGQSPQRNLDVFFRRRKRKLNVFVVASGSQPHQPSQGHGRRRASDQLKE